MVIQQTISLDNKTNMHKETTEAKKVKKNSYKRIVAHTDFDGLIAAFFLREMFGIEEVVFTEPWLIQKREFDVLPGDVIVDLPYDERCAFWLDHHKSSLKDALVVRKERPNDVVFDENQPSSPGLIYAQYKKEFPFLETPESRALIEAADKIDSGNFVLDDFVHPDVFGKISMSLRSDDKKKDDEYRTLLLNLLSFLSPQKVLEQQVVAQRVKASLENTQKEIVAFRKYAYLHKEYPIVIVDLVGTGEKIPRFQPYIDYPDCLLSISINDMKEDPERLKVSIGKNIFKKGSFAHPVDISSITTQYGGGGHAAVGGCSILKAKKDDILKEILQKLFAPT